MLSPEPQSPRVISFLVCKEINSLKKVWSLENLLKRFLLHHTTTDQWFPSFVALVPQDLGTGSIMATSGVCSVWCVYKVAPQDARRGR